MFKELNELEANRADELINDAFADIKALYEGSNVYDGETGKLYPEEAIVERAICSLQELKKILTEYTI